MLYIPSPLKRCSCCKSLKCVAEFPRNRSKRDGFATECHICNRQRVRNWAKANPEKVRQGKNLYLAKNPSRRRDTITRYLAASRAIRNERRRLRYKNDRNPRRQEAHRRQAAKHRCPSSFTQEQWKHCLEFFHGVCAYCGNPPRLWDRSPVLTQDHFVPVSAGGGYSASNIVPACDACNSSKRDQPADKWLKNKVGQRKAKQVLKRIYDYFASISKT